MRLAEFIQQDMAGILADWEAFARTQLPAAAVMSDLALRNHARQLLEAVAADLSTPQDRGAQMAKSWGNAPKPVSAPRTAAQTHALMRAKSGFNINQLVAEYRALRASVLRHWMNAVSNTPNMDDVVRFNEAIDQAIAESVGHYSAKVEQGRNLFLGMLGHDLRTPLQAIRMTATHLAALNASSAVTEAASRLIRSGVRMQSLLDDLVDFNRTTLGFGIHIAPTSVDIADLFAEEVSQLKTVHTGCPIELEIAGSTRGVWDGPRLQQLLGNLVVNAIKYGAANEPVRVGVVGSDGEISIQVRNHGPAIDPEMLSQIFEPLTRGEESPGTPADDTSLGLGLYIAREIARGHGGSIEVKSAAAQTVFEVRLPRRSSGPASSALPGGDLAAGAPPG